MKKHSLMIVPSVPVWEYEGAYLFDEKFYDGLQYYISGWSGNVKCLMSVSTGPLPNFGRKIVKLDDLNFDLQLKNEEEPYSSEHFHETDIVLASADAVNQLSISEICHHLGIMCVYIIEYIPETRYQIVLLENVSLLRKLRRLFFVWNTERKRKRAFRLVSGLQSNGCAAYTYYKPFVTSSLLYFDTRVRVDMLATKQVVAKRFSRLVDKKSLNLVFSGRLVKMKGADQLIQLAQVLSSQLNLKFTMNIFGTGELENSMRQSIEDNNLSRIVKLHGPVDFETKLIPYIKEYADIFVCLHRQSDPSCTYLETLSCGVPIVGYDNRAFEGILQQADIGWSSKMDDIDKLASLISDISSDLNTLETKSVNALEFASKHTFETTFSRRLEHLQSFESPHTLQK